MASNFYAWKTTAELAALYDLNTWDTLAKLTNLGLRDRQTGEWHPHIFSDGIARRRGHRIEWNFCAVDALDRGVYPKDQTWNEYVDLFEFHEMIKNYR